MSIDNLLKQEEYLPGKESIDSIFVEWTNSHPDYVVHVCKGAKADIYKIEDKKENKHHIIWDECFWTLFISYLFIVNENNINYYRDNNMIIEDSGYMISLILQYMSTRYLFFPELSEKLKQKANEYGYGILKQIQENDDTDDFPVIVCKMYAFWHEIAHIEFTKFEESEELFTKYVDQVYDVLGHLSDNAIDALSTDSDIDISKEIKNRSVSLDIIEELAADLRAFQRVFESLESSNVLQRLDEVSYSLNSLIQFSVIKSIVDKRWDHYLYNKKDRIPKRLAIQVYRCVVFPYITNYQYTIHKLGKSYYHDVRNRNQIERIVQTAIDITMSEWFIIHNLGKNIFINDENGDAVQQIQILDSISSHMHNLPIEKTSRYLQQLFERAFAKQHSDNPKEAIPLYFDFIDKCQKKKGESKEYIADAYARIARIYAMSGDKNSANIVLQNALDIVEQIRNAPKETSFLYNNIGNAYHQMGNIEKAKEYYNTAFQLRKAEEDNESVEMARIMNNLGDCAMETGEKENALKYYLQSYLIGHTRFVQYEMETLINQMRRLCSVEKINMIRFKNNDIPLKRAEDWYNNNPEDIELVELYTECLVRDIIHVDFEKACEYYFIIDELQKKKKSMRMFRNSQYGYINMCYMIKNKFGEIGKSEDRSV